jgi:transcriptional regulator with XRE-family HTH domain
MNSAVTLKARRVGAGISGDLVCRKTSLDRARLSKIERGVADPTPEELVKIYEALDELIVAKFGIQQRAAELGWPEVLLDAGLKPNPENPAMKWE